MFTIFFCLSQSYIFRPLTVATQNVVEVVEIIDVSCVFICRVPTEVHTNPIPTCVAGKRRGRKERERRD